MRFFYLDRKTFMHKWVIHSGKIAAGGIVVFIICCFLFDALVQLRMSDDELLNLLSSHGVKGEVKYFTSQGRNIRYISVGDDNLPTVLFIHGSPSSLSIYKDYYTDAAFLRSFHIYSIDRPGYGNSGYGKPLISLQQQAAIIKDMVDSINKIKRPFIIAAGSYGTSVACRFAMDYPQLLDGLVLTGPALGPGLEHTYWFTPAVESPLINWFIPRMFQSSNKEKITHKDELTKMLPYWKNIQVPVMYMQGEKDELIDTANASFAKAHLTNAPYLYIHFFKGKPHFIPISEHLFIRQKIFDMLKIIREQKKGFDYEKTS